MDEISESLMAMIDYAEATKKYADAGSLRRVRDGLDRLRTQADALAEALRECLDIIESDTDWTHRDSFLAGHKALAAYEEGKK